MSLRRYRLEWAIVIVVGVVLFGLFVTLVGPGDGGGTTVHNRPVGGHVN